jgi:hypothetical protein
VLKNSAPDSVRCPRTVQVSTSHSRENEGALCYNSPDCSVCHRIVWWASGAMTICTQWSTLIAWIVSYSAATEVRAAKSEDTRLSCVAPDCPVPQEDKAPTVDSTPNPNGWVTWQRTESRTVPVRCALRHRPPQQLWKWLEAINTPQPPHSYQSKHSKYLIQYKSKRLHSKTHQIDWILS